MIDYEVIILKELDINDISSICIYHEIRQNINGDIKLIYGKEFMIDTVDKSFSLELNRMLMQAKLARDICSIIPRTLNVFLGSVIYNDGTIKYLDIDDILDIRVENANEIIVKPIID